MCLLLTCRSWWLTKGSLIATHVKFTDKSVSFQVILGNLKLWMTIELAKL